MTGELFLKSGYESREAPEYFEDALAERAGIVHQPDVYEFARFLAALHGCTTIVDLGCGRGAKLAPLASEFELVGVDYGGNLREARKRVPQGTWIEWDLEVEEPIPLEADATHAAILCIDVIEHLRDPLPLLRNIRRLLDDAPFALISTPERDLARGRSDVGPPENVHHVREWNLTELERLLVANGFRVPLIGLTASHDDGYPKATTLAVVESPSGPVPERRAPPDDFQVVAFVPTYNEADVIEATVTSLMDEGIDVHVIDNWSTDETWPIVERLPVEAERFPSAGPSPLCDWRSILARMEELSVTLEADWFMHVDADERRRAPWPGVGLRDAVYFVEQRGFDCIDHTVLEFHPVDDEFVSGDVERALRCFDFGARPGHFLQRKAWKKTETRPEIAASGGHDTVFPGRRVYPYKFLLKHYPIRSQAHGERKVFGERIDRYEPREREAGWHVHYDALAREHRFVRDPSTLIEFDEERFNREYLVERLSGIGIKRESDDEWLDGSEAEVLAVLRRARDRSSSSDELAAAIHDWPTRYHFSRLRPKLLGPLRIGPGLRVLDLGGGTGPLTRRLGELGAEVVLLDGSEARVEAAAVRCEELDNVSTAVGTIDDVEQPFDVVLVVGVLEYAQPEELLRKAASLIVDDGVLAVAIENAIGLKYLLGYAEDHVALPWVGLEGYPGIDHVRTYSRRELAALVGAAGLPEQTWFFPFPDYKLPTTVVSERAYALDNIVDAIVPQPCSPDASPPTQVRDARATHRTLLRAGLGPETANSFLVVAGRTSDALDRHVDRETLAWLNGSERKARFMRARRLVSEGSDLAIVDDSASAHEIEADGLIQRRFPSVAFEHGDGLDLLVSEALAAGDEQRVSELVTLWTDALREHAVGGKLPGDHLDAQPANFVYRDGQLHRIDAEWEAREPVELAEVCVRGLFHFSVDVSRRGIAPGTPDRTLADAIAVLAQAGGIEGHKRALERLPETEAALQATVVGLPAEDIRADIERLLGTPVSELTDLPIPAAEQADGELDSLREEIDWRSGVMEAQAAELTTLQRSRSVRYTEPLRRVAARLRRRGS